MSDATAAISERESEVLAALAERLTNAEIGQRLHISVRTVESHVSSLLRKLDLGDRRALAAYGSSLSELRCDDEDGGAGLQGAPSALTTFVGRDALVPAVVEALASARLVTLAGPGGVGKTRLAVEAGTAAAVGLDAWFVDLVPVRAGGVVTAVARAVGVIDRPNQSLEDVVRDTLRARRALLVVDNCEHVLEEVAALVERLLLACPGLRVLGTSRELLAVPGERVVVVASLDDAEAAALFGERAALLDPDFDLDAHREEVAEVCARLDGIPLAIELAAARCAVLGLDGVRAGLADRLGLLASTRRPDERHRSLREVLDWSHDLLDADEQLVLRRLGAFAADFTIDDAAAVVGIDVVDPIARLTAKSLLVRRRRGEVSTYRLLETVHEYAHERLGASDDVEPVRARHLAWAAQAMADVEGQLDGGEGWRHRFEAVADDARLALDRAVGPESHGLARAHAHVAYARRFLTEAQATYELAATLAPTPVDVAQDLRAAAAVAYARMRADLSHDLLLAAAEACQVDDPAGAATALADAATFAWRCPAEFPSPPEEPRVAGLVARAMALDPGDDPVVAAHLATAAAWRPTNPLCGGDLTLSLRAVEAAQAIGDLALLSCAYDAVTVAYAADGKVGDAARTVEERMRLIDRFARHDPSTGGEVIDGMHMAADTALAAGRPQEGLQHALLMRKDELGETSPHAAGREAVIALTLLGRFPDAIAEADNMRRDWELAGRPSARWMVQAAIAASLAHGLLGDHASALEWEAVAEEINGHGAWSPVQRVFRAFTRARVALHEGRLDDARAVVGDWDPSAPSAYAGYAAALQAELDAGAIAVARSFVDENAYGQALLLRAEGRHGDEAKLREALAAFDGMGARFEWASTAVLLGDPVGNDVLRQLTCVDDPAA